MQLEAVTVCVNYADFLQEVASHNLAVLDRWLIVTDPRDIATREVCRKFGLEVILSEDHKRDAKSTPSDNFNKGRMIERGLLMLSADSWRVHMDCDIVLPNVTRHVLRAAHLDESKLYGADRFMVHGAAQWDALKASGWMMHVDGWRAEFPKGYEVGSRWVSGSQGYAPCGFFQLWHADEDEPNGVRVKPYPHAHNNACRTDIQHSLRWDRRKRELLPELIVAHLDSLDGLPMGANWSGRTTPSFRQKGSTGRHHHHPHHHHHHHHYGR